MSVHPVIIYPFNHPKDEKDLRYLYDTFISGILHETCKPITVINQQTNHRNLNNKSFISFIETYVKPVSYIEYAWCVDTCQMWLTGLGKAIENDSGTDRSSDVYWLIPGDFPYSSESGKELLDGMEKIKNETLSQNPPHDLCIGEITVSPNSPKQLIDTYGTYGLLYNWFPDEAKKIREKTNKPRTEFFCIKHDYLMYLLVNKRWFAYEQTLIMLLEGIHDGEFTRNIKCIKLNNVEDISQGREVLSSAMQQVERTERVLKLYWRERNERTNPKWPEEFKRLDQQSEQIRATALVVLENLLS